jgi:hypothetical protein
MPRLDLHDAIPFVREEIDRQKILHGDNRIGSPLLSDTQRMTILTEEVGEIAKAILEDETGELKEELIQVAACALAWYLSCS